MNSFPVIFARGRELSQLARIRECFAQKSSASPSLGPQATKIVLRPKETKVKLKRPATARTLKKPQQSREKSPEPVSGHATTELIGSRFVRKIQASPMPALKPMTFVMFPEQEKRPISHARTPPPPSIQERTPEPRSRSVMSTKPRHQLTRSKSAEFFDTMKLLSGRQSKESEMWTLSNSEVSPNQRIPKEDLSPFGSTSPLRHANSRLNLLEGEATLPSQFAYSHYFMKLFGTPLKRSEARLALLSHLSSIGVRISASSHVRVTHNSESEEVYVIITGGNAPLTQCCGATVIFAFNRESVGKVLCCASYCPSRTVANFHVPMELKEKLWTESVARTSMSSKELSTHVRKGSYKTMSLRREMDKRCQTAERRTERLLLTSSKPIFSNEKLKFVTPQRPNAGLRLPVDLQIDTLTPPSFSSQVRCNPLHQVLKRTSSRHNTVKKQYTTDELLEHLSHLLQD